MVLLLLLPSKQQRSACFVASKHTITLTSLGVGGSRPLKLKSEILNLPLGLIFVWFDIDLHINFIYDLG